MIRMVACANQMTDLDQIVTHKTWQMISMGQTLCVVGVGSHCNESLSYQPAEGDVMRHTSTRRLACYSVSKMNLPILQQSHTGCTR